MDVTGRCYPGLMYCLIEYLMHEFEGYYNNTKIPGWANMHQQLVRVEIALINNNNGFTINPEFPDKDLHIANMKHCQSIAKDLLGHHMHINLLWRVEQMIKNWDRQKVVAFRQFEFDGRDVEDDG